jgi:hypothetical protein
MRLHGAEIGVGEIKTAPDREEGMASTTKGADMLSAKIKEQL